MNFNELLQNELLQNELNDTKDDKNICHITFEELKDDHIVFDCKHTFNYDAIFKEVFIQKTVVNRKECQKLAKYCIKCPYCRFIQKGILPHRNGYELIPRVNTPKCRAMKIKKFQCKYVFASGKNKGNTCSKYSEFEYCSQHKTIIEKRKAKLQNQQKNTHPINEIISHNIIDTLASSIYKQIISEGWQETCEKKHTFHPIFNKKKNNFNACCSHTFKRGKYKGETCPKFVNATSSTGSPNYQQKYFCNYHSKLKSNKNHITPKPYFVPLFNENLSQGEINKYYKDFIVSHEYDYVENKGFYYNKECHSAKKTINNAKMTQHHNVIMV